MHQGNSHQVHAIERAIVIPGVGVGILVVYRREYVLQLASEAKHVHFNRKKLCLTIMYMVTIVHDHVMFYETWRISKLMETKNRILTICSKTISFRKL